MVRSAARSIVSAIDLECLVCTGRLEGWHEVGFVGCGRWLVARFEGFGLCFVAETLGCG